MPYNPGGRNAGRARQNRNQTHLGQSGRQVVEALDESSPTIKAFRSIQQELDDNHNCYERIVKLSRDATIESKRVIFLLHSLDSENKRDAVLTEAQERLTKLKDTIFQKIAVELQGRDPYDFIRAYTSGLQEYVEAVTFLSYRKDKTLPHWKLIQNNFEFVKPAGNPQDTDSESTKQAEEVGQQAEKNLQSGVPDTVKCLITPIDYVLGVADLTGELMRLCINSLGMGNSDDCFKVCSFAQALYLEFSKIGHVPSREYGHKTHIFQQSLQKMETTCYNIVVRGEEMPKSLLLAVTLNEKQDEGYCD